MVNYRVFGAGVLIQSGGKRLRAPGPQPLVGVPDIEFEVVFEIAHVMSPFLLSPLSHDLLARRPLR
jgi:hypothetical protein